MRAKNRVLVLTIITLSLLFLIGLGGTALAHDAENGRELFGEYCAVCHGYDGQGRVGATLTGWFAGIDPEAFVGSTVSDGIAGTMPAFARSKGGPLTDEEIDDIAAYILSWQERVEPAPTPTAVPVTPIPQVVGVIGDPTAGAQVFARECQLCHGERGQGGIGASLSGPIAASQPAAFIRQVVNNGVTGSPMPAFAGVLTADQIEDTVAFILSWGHEPTPSTPTEPEDEGGFNWLVGLLFLIVALAVIVWLITRFSGQQNSKTPQ
jgi:cytochrome c oxidase cbb3-type subunit 3